MSLNGCQSPCVLIVGLSDDCQCLSRQRFGHLWCNFILPCRALWVMDVPVSRRCVMPNRGVFCLPVSSFVNLVPVCTTASSETPHVWHGVFWFTIVRLVSWTNVHAEGDVWDPCATQWQHDVVFYFWKQCLWSGRRTWWIPGMSWLVELTSKCMTTYCCW